MTSVSFVTWQFVRLMVRLEESLDRDGQRQSLYGKWQADWEKLDRELDRLRKDDFGAFSDLMMEHEIRFDDASSDDLMTAAGVIDEVANQLGHVGKPDDRAQRRDIEFEAKELTTLADALRRDAQSRKDKS